MEVTHENSMKEYDRLLKTPPLGRRIPIKLPRTDPYAVKGKSLVALVQSNGRSDGVKEALRLIGGLQPLCKGVKGEIIIKPNCNTDDPFPRNTHHETVRIIAENLIDSGISAEQIVVGDMSGRYRGLPTRHTMSNMGITKVANDLGIQLSYFEEEDWVTLNHPRNRAWPNGIKIPRRIYEADRVILTPIMRPHISATFTIALKLAVGLIDAVGREWLHNGEAFYEKMVELNLAFSADLVVTDAMKFYTDSGPTHYFGGMVEPGIIIVGTNIVAADAVAATLMKQYGAHGLIDQPILEHKQFTLAEDLDLGKSKKKDMDLKTSNLIEDENFETLISQIKAELEGQ